MSLSALPAIEFLLLILFLRKQPGTANLTLKEQSALAFITLSAVLCLSTEILSFFSILYEGPITLLHILISLGLLASLYAIPRTTTFSLNASSELPIIAFAILCAIPAFITALAAPPNNWDSMTYHLPRIFHWLQNHSLEHYATYVVRQLYLNPGHEILLTHLIGLAGSDLHAGLFNALSFLIALITVAAITERLGGNKTTQIVAITFAATIPMAILQSHTTQNDLLHGVFLLTCTLGALLTRASPSLSRQFLMWSSAGLAVLTKGLALVYLPPLILLVFPCKSLLSARSRATTLVGILLFLALSIGHFHRNYRAFENPLGPTTGPHTIGMYSIASPTIAATISNIIRNIALHSNSAFAPFQRALNEVSGPIHSLLAIDPNDPLTTWMGTDLSMLQPGAINEDLAGNGNHLLLIAVTLIVIVITARKSQYAFFSALRPICAAILAGIILSAVTKWQPWASRLHLPLFLIAVPSVALVITQRLGLIISAITSLFLLTQALPYWAHNHIRPLTGPNSVLHQPTRPERFAAKPFLAPEFRRLSRHLKQKRCQSIGVIASEDEWEQPLFTNLYTRPTVHACPAPSTDPRHLWLPDRASPNPDICALVWFGADAPERLETCGGTFTRIDGPQNVSLFTLQKE